jgi:hypothetical protein
MAGEKSPFGSDERRIYSTKANALRETLKKMGYANVDADYGAGVSLANTPGGGKIDWNVLANAADILGTTQAGSTRGAFDRALGEYLTRNLPVWQKQSAASPSAAVTTTTPNIMGGSSASASIAEGQPIRGGVTGGENVPASTWGNRNIAPTSTWGGSPPSVGRSSVTGTPSELGTASGSISKIPMGADPNQPATGATITPTGTGAGMGTGAGVYGDFIQSEYFKNNDYEGYFISKVPNLPTIKDPATGKVTIDWANPKMPANMYTLYGDYTKLWNTTQGLSKDKANIMDIAAIEKNPAFIEQGKVFAAEMELLLKQNTMSVDAQIAGLKGSIDANKAGLEYELTTIKREIGASNWRSRQSLAASGMAFSGMLGYLYGQNEAKGMDATIRATAITAAEIKAIGEQMAILDGSKLAYASDLEGLYGAKKAAYRASLLDPQNARYQEIDGLLSDAIANMETTTAMAAPSLAMGERAATESAAAIDYERTKELGTLDKNGIAMTQDPTTGKWTWKITATADEKLAQDMFALDSWYKKEGMKLNWESLDMDKNKQTFYEWATKAGLAMDQKQLDLAWAQFAEQRRSNLAGEEDVDLSREGEADTGGYNADADLKILSNSGASAEVVNQALLRLTAGRGALSDTNFVGFMQGGRYAIDATGNATLLQEGQKVPKGSREMTLPGLFGLDSVKAEQTLHLIEDPVRQMAATVALFLKSAPRDQQGDWFDAMQTLISSNATKLPDGKENPYGYDFSVQEVAAIEKILIGYFGTKPGPGGTIITTRPEWGGTVEVGQP